MIDASTLTPMQILRNQEARLQRVEAFTHLDVPDNQIDPASLNEGYEPPDPDAEDEENPPVEPNFDDPG